MKPTRSAGSASPAPVDAMSSHAVDNLSYIRRTMHRAGAFSALSGPSIVIIGLSAFPAAFIASSRAADGAWALTWMVVAVLDLVFGVWMTWRRAGRVGQPYFSGSGRRFLTGFSLPLLAAAILTPVLLDGGLADRLPGMWLLLYGTALGVGGLSSIRVVPLIGAVFMILGGIAFLLPSLSRDLVMIGGFGGVHVLFGILIWGRRDGTDKFGAALKAARE